MTKTLAWSIPVLLLIGIPFVPIALAHGAAPAREIDTRLLADDDGAVSPGFCTSSGCAPNQDAGGLDLLTLDIRETHLASGAPAVGFRVVFQSATATKDGRTVTVSFKAGSTDKSFEFHGAGPDYNSTTCDAFTGPFPVGDGEPQAVDCLLAYANLGVSVGDKIAGATMLSSVGADKYDAAPGTWYSNGQLVPKVPDDTPSGPDDLTATGAALDYTLAGPAKLLAISATATVLDPSHAAATMPVVVANNLTATDDFVTLRLNATAGITASLDQASLDLKAKSTKTATLTVSKASKDGMVNLTLVSALGEYRTILVPVKGSAVASNMTGMGSMTMAHMTSTSTTSKKSPAVPLGAFVVVVALALLVRRRF